MRLALLVSVGLILYTGVFPGVVLEFARESVQGLGALGGGMARDRAVVVVGIACAADH